MRSLTLEFHEVSIPPEGEADSYSFGLGFRIILVKRQYEFMRSLTLEFHEVYIPPEGEADSYLEV
jgi:hypothetical protein